MRGVLILGLALLLQTTATRAEPDYAALNEALTDAVVLPAYQGLAEATAALSGATERACDGPAAARFAALDDAFQAAMDAWQRAQPFAHGPIARNDRAADIQLWPERDGQARKAVERALAAADPVLTAPEGLQQARLRSLVPEDTAVLLSVNMGAGHGGDPGRFEGYRLWAFQYAYVLGLFGIAE